MCRLLRVDISFHSTWRAIRGVAYRYSRISQKSFRCKFTMQNHYRSDILRSFHLHIKEFSLQIYFAKITTEPTFGEAHTYTSLVRGEESLFLTILKSHFAANLPHKNTTEPTFWEFPIFTSLVRGEESLCLTIHKSVPYGDFTSCFCSELIFERGDIWVYFIS